MPVVAVVDDCPMDRHIYSALLEKEGYEVELYTDGQDFLDHYTPKPGCIVLNMLMPNMCGWGTLVEMQKRGWNVPVIGNSMDPSYEDLMLRTGAVAFFRSLDSIGLMDAVESFAGWCQVAVMNNDTSSST